MPDELETAYVAVITAEVLLLSVPVTAIWLTGWPAPPTRPGANGAVQVYLVPAGSVGVGTIKLNGAPEQALMVYVCPLTALNDSKTRNNKIILFTGKYSFSVAYKIIECDRYWI